MRILSENGHEVTEIQIEFKNVVMLVFVRCPINKGFRQYHLCRKNVRGKANGFFNSHLPFLV